MRTDSSEGLNEKVEAIYANNTIDGVFALAEDDSVAALKFGLKKKEPLITSKLSFIL